MKKRVILVSALIMVLMTLTSCGPRFYVSEYDNKLEHEEWYEHFEDYE